MKNYNILALVALSISAFCQGITQPLELPNAVDGKVTAIKACASCQGVVVIFTSLTCPYDQLYQDRIKALSAQYAGRISFFLVDSNPGAEENETKMKAAYAGWNMSLSFLADKKQIAMKALHATRTPEAVLLKSEGKNLTIVYHGAIDDNPQVKSDTEKNFLNDAITDLLAGKAIQKATERVIGCTIRKGE